MPTLVGLDVGEIIVGFQAAGLAKTSPHLTADYLLRDVEGEVRLGSETRTVQECLTRVVEHVRRSAEAEVGQPVTMCVLAVPAARSLAASIWAVRCWTTPLWIGCLLIRKTKFRTSCIRTTAPAGGCWAKRSEPSCNCPIQTALLC